MGRQQYSTSLPEDLIEWLREESERSGFPQSRIVEKALMLYRERWERAMRPAMEEMEEE